jgi:hypothetical protein
MESIVISQKKLATEVFYAFSASRNINGHRIDVDVSNDLFGWYIPNGPEQEEFIVFKISREDIAFRATIHDMTIHLMRKWSEFEKELKDKL